MNTDFAGFIFGVNNKYCTDVPSLTDSQQFVDDMFHLLFPVRESINISLSEVANSTGSNETGFKGVTYSII
jgi:hypothetical protein